MEKAENNFNRRSFIRKTGTLTAGLAGMALFPQPASSMYNTDENINIIGRNKVFHPI